MADMIVSDAINTLACISEDLLKGEPADSLSLLALEQAADELWEHGYISGKDAVRLLKFASDCRERHG